MNMRKKVFIGVIVVLLITALGWYIDNNYEYKNVIIKKELSGEPARNPLYATRLLLKNMGIPAEEKTLDQYFEKDINNHTVIVLDTYRMGFTEERLENLLSWVAAGGHLITKADIDNGLGDLTRFTDESDSEDESDDEYLDENDELEDESYLDDEQDTSESFLKTSSDSLINKALGIYTGTAYELDDDSEGISKDKHKTSDKHKGESISKTDSEEDSDKEPTLLDLRLYKPIKHYSFAAKLPNMQGPRLLDIGHYFYPIEGVQTDDHIIRIKGRIFLLQRRLGKGLITLASDLDFMGNHLLREADNAEITWQLMHQHNKPHNVWLVVDDDIASLWSILLDKAWMLMLSALLVFLFLFWQKSPRFGPLLSTPLLERKRMMEHIRASGQFAWQHKQSEPLLVSTQQAVLKKARDRIPGWQQKNQQQQVELLAQQLQWPEQDLETLLYSTTPLSGDAFTQTIKQLETIRNRL